MNTQIELAQKPIIKHALIEIGERVTNRLAELDIENQVATTDTVKALKELRVELNKELTSFEEQRKAVKSGVLSPYDEFEAVYKTEVSTKYANAINLLKDKIASVEDAIKEEKKENIISYFAELCLSENIDFVTFDRLTLDINLSTTEKSYKEKVNEFVSRIKDDVSLIHMQDNEAEIMAEYKKTLNASTAIKTIFDRKNAEKAEADRIKADEQRRRKAVMAAIGLVYVGITKSYEYDADIYITAESVENMSKPEFQKCVSGIQFSIEAKKIPVVTKFDENGIADIDDLFEKESPNATSVITDPKAVAGTITAPQIVATPIAAPTVEKAPVILTATFEAKGTREQLLSIAAFMKQNSITYTNV